MDRKTILQFTALACICWGSAEQVTVKAGENPAGELGLIPKPAKIETGNGSFHLSSGCRILMNNEYAVKTTAEYLAEFLHEVTGGSFPLQEVMTISPSNCIFLTIQETYLGKEGYKLSVSTNAIVISAFGPAGLFYGVQTLRQLLPETAFSRKRVAGKESFDVPCVRIEDYPRFAWRGMHLDVSRQFFDIQFIKRYLDQLAMHKINVFHWHLTDDDGWRVEIKKYPKLTQVGAWRGPKEALPPSYESGNKRYGGFYTQKQIREVVRYAAARHMMVLPEVDVPAHCRAAIVAYPDLLCTGDPYKFKSAQEVAANVLCPSQEKTYQFLEGVFGELAELFPSEWIHAGGDERPEGPWEQCDRCRKRMKDEDLADGRFLQDRFLKRLQTFLKSRGKKMIGWDELEQESVLDKDYTVMAWNSVDAGIAAAKKGYPVIMAPSPFTYFDLAYNEDPAEPVQRWAGVISVEKAYSFDPNPAALPPDIEGRIIGVHGCLWSEMLVTADRPDYMEFPRVCALAEVGWTRQGERAWPEFWNRLCKYHFSRLDAAGIRYRIPPPATRRDGEKVTIIRPYSDAQVRYTLDGSEPNSRSTLYNQPFNLPKDSVLKMRTFRPNGRGSPKIIEKEKTTSVP